MSTITTPLTAVDAFCGPGGLSLGLRGAGLQVCAAFDVHGPSVVTYHKNLGDHVFQRDVRTLSGRELLDLAGLTPGQLDLLAGGPPCQGFSKQKRGAHLGDPRNSLVLEQLRLVEELLPRAFLLENVSMLAQVRGRHLVERFHSLDEYSLVGHFYLAADYGVAQTRERFILVGVRRDAAGDYVVPPPTVPRWLTVRDVIGDLPEPPTDYRDHPDLPNHQAARVTQLNVERFAHVPEGGGWQDIPYPLRLKCHQVVDTRSGGWPDVYGRLRWDGPCPTVTGCFDSFTRGRYGHPRTNRPLTPGRPRGCRGSPTSTCSTGLGTTSGTRSGTRCRPPWLRPSGARFWQPCRAARMPLWDRNTPLSSIDHV